MVSGLTPDRARSADRPAGLGVRALPLAALADVDRRLVQEDLELGARGAVEDLLRESQRGRAGTARDSRLGQDDLGGEYRHSLRVVVVVIIIVVVVVVVVVV